jgi:Coenzyme PQQ synthesis protein D (PqqD)
MTPSEPRLRLRNTDWRTIEGETIILDRETERYLSLNRSGTLMWERLVAGTTRADLVGLLRETFGIGADLAEADVDAFVADLRRHGLIDDTPG